MLTEPLIALLNRLPLRVDAKRMVSIIPLGSIYWDDEMPDGVSVARLPEDEQNMMWQLFAIRFRIWDNEELTAEDKSFWDSARSEVPDWALFQRLALSEDDRKAREKAEKDVEKELDAVFGDADQIRLTDKGRGIQEMSVTFDLTKKPAEGRAIGGWRRPIGTLLILTPLVVLIGVGILGVLLGSMGMDIDIHWNSTWARYIATVCIVLLLCACVLCGIRLRRSPRA